jgi:hypothetical protein
MGMQAPGNQAAPPQAGGGPNPNQPDIMATRNWNYPRWPLLAALLLMPAVCLGYSLYLLDIGHTCYVPLFCTMVATLPAVGQILLVWSAFGLLWLLSIAFGGARLEGTGSRGPLATLLRDLSNFTPIRGLLIWSGVVALLSILLVTLLGRMSALGFALAMLIVFVAAMVWLWQPPEQVIANQAQQSPFRQAARRAGNALYILRNLVPFRYIFPNQAPQPQAANPAAPQAAQPAQGQPVGAAAPPQPPPQLQQNVPPPGP